MEFDYKNKYTNYTQKYINEQFHKHVYTYTKLY